MTHPDTLELATVMIEEVRRRLSVLDRIMWHVARLRAFVAEQRDAGLFYDGGSDREQAVQAALRKAHKVIDESLEGLSLPDSLWKRSEPPLSRVERTRRWSL